MVFFDVQNTEESTLDKSKFNRFEADFTLKLI